MGNEFEIVYTINYLRFSEKYDISVLDHNRVSFQ